MPGLAPPTANQITAELLLKIPRVIPNALCWRQNSGKGIGWNQVRAVKALLKRRDIEGALKYLDHPISFGLVGAPDIMIIAPGPKVGGVEVKAEYSSGDSDSQGLNQEAWEHRVCGMGGFYILADHIGWLNGKPNISSVLEKLKEFIK